MNSVISSVLRTQTANPAAASKMESETIKSTEEVTGGQNLATESSVSSKYDTLELSKEYIKYKTLSENSALHDQTSQLNTTVLQFAGATRNNKSIAYNYQLYNYTESELAEMLFGGKISLEEYDEEIEARKSESKKPENRKQSSNQSSL